MAKVHAPARAGKRVSSRDDGGTVEALAFEAGKRASSLPNGAASCPYGAPDLRAAWSRGRLYATALAAGLVPLETARRGQPPPAGQP